MKISNIFQATNIIKSNIKPKKQKNSIPKKSDNINISSQAIDFQNTLKAVNKSPDIREEKVKEISEKIKNGTYFISSEQIINKMIKND